MDDIIQSRKHLTKLRRRLNTLRRKSANLRHKDLESLAQSLGRVSSQRGKEPTYVNPTLPRSRPLTIPNHPGALARYTAESILDQLEEDLFALCEQLDQEAERRGP